MYGTTAENVVSLQVVTPEGKLVRTRRRVRKSATGYEMTQLFIGSEGTLGIIVGLTLKLRKIPKVFVYLSHFFSGFYVHLCGSPPRSTSLHYLAF